MGSLASTGDSFRGLTGPWSDISGIDHANLHALKQSFLISQDSVSMGFSVVSWSWGLSPSGTTTKMALSHSWQLALAMAWSPFGAIEHLGLCPRGLCIWLGVLSVWSLSFQEEESTPVFSKSVLGSSRKILPLYPLVKTNSRGNPNSRGEEIDCLLMQEMAKNLWPSLI